jgi:hypothetical protein
VAIVKSNSRNAWITSKAIATTAVTSDEDTDKLLQSTSKATRETALMFTVYEKLRPQDGS